MSFGSGKRRTLAHQRRFDAIKGAGCLACRIECMPHDGGCEVHHLLSGGVRIGHEATIGLCFWHHRGSAQSRQTDGACLVAYGPSYHRHKRAFAQRYGSDAELLAMQDAIIEGRG